MEQKNNTTLVFNNKHLHIDALKCKSIINPQSRKKGPNDTIYTGQYNLLILMNSTQFHVLYKPTDAFSATKMISRYIIVAGDGSYDIS